VFVSTKQNAHFAMLGSRKGNKVEDQLISLQQPTLTAVCSLVDVQQQLLEVKKVELELKRDEVLCMHILVYHHILMMTQDLLMLWCICHAASDLLSCQRGAKRKASCPTLADCMSSFVIIDHVATRHHYRLLLLRIYLTGSVANIDN